MIDELDKARRQLARLAMENRLIATENRRLRRLAVNRRGPGRTLHRAMEDAKAMLLWRYAGLSVSRRACVEYGMSERRWEWARALLLAARVWDGLANDVAQVHADDIQRAMAAVEYKADQIAANGDMGLLIMRRRRYREASEAAAKMASD